MTIPNRKVLPNLQVHIIYHITVGITLLALNCSMSTTCEICPNLIIIETPELYQ